MARAATLALRVRDPLLLQVHQLLQPYASVNEDDQDCPSRRAQERLGIESAENRLRVVIARQWHSSRGGGTTDNLPLLRPYRSMTSSRVSPSADGWWTCKRTEGESSRSSDSHGMAGRRLTARSELWQTDAR
jgi:hypothetical protein